MLFIDIETYAAVDLKTVGVYRYVEDPEFEILMAAWAHDDDPVQVAVGEAEIAKIPGLWEHLVKCAHNAQFERVCFSRFAWQLRAGAEWPAFLPPEEWLDSMALAAEYGYPQSLDGLGRALGGELKNTKAGDALVRFFCKPNRAGKRNLPKDHPEKWAEFIEYCRQDVVTHRDAVRRLGGVFPTETERQMYIADQKINDLGIAIDLPMVKAAQAAARDNALAHETELCAITGVDNPRSTQQLLAWFQGQGLRSMKDMTADTVEAQLQRDIVKADTGKARAVRRALELRQELALVAAKKYTSALDMVSADGRLRGQYRFHGAHTGRWSSRGVQIHNLARLAFKSDLPAEAPEAEHDRRAEVLAEAAILDLKMGMGGDAEVLKKLIRSMFVGPFAVVDYSAIEARVLAWLAGEQWVLDAFRAGRDIYVETAARMSTPSKPLGRSQGKVAVLALGFQGAVNSLRAMGAEGTDEELWHLVDVWRTADPNIVAFWPMMENAFIEGGSVGQYCEIEKKGADRIMRFPSGRAMVYHNIKPGETFYDPKTNRRYKGIGFDSPKIAGARAATYGGRLTENLTQGVARDIMGEAIIRLQMEGYRVAGHTHDEIITDLWGPAQLGYDLQPFVDNIGEIMCASPAWSTDMPIAAAGFACNRYRKG